MHSRFTCGKAAALALAALCAPRLAAAAAGLDPEAAMADARGPPLMRRSGPQHEGAFAPQRSAEDSEDPMWEGVDDVDLAEDLEDEVRMPEMGSASLLDEAGGGNRLHRQRGSARHMELRAESLEEETAEQTVAREARLKALASRLTIEGLEEAKAGHGAGDAAARDLPRDQYLAKLLSDALSTTTTTTTGCFDRERNIAPIISMDGVPMECPSLKQFCEGAGDKSIYVALKCPKTCYVCESYIPPDPTGIPRETHCFRRRRHGYCYTRRRRYG